MQKVDASASTHHGSTRVDPPLFPNQQNGRVDAALADRLRSDLLAASYTVDRLRSLWGDAADAALARGDRVPARRALARREPEPAAQLARLFLLGEQLDTSSVQCALPSLGAAGALALGLIDPHGRALLDVRPYSTVDASGTADWFVVSDLGETALGRALPAEHVLGVGGASLTLAGLIPTNSVGTVLDLGTGCGVQSLHAARHAQRVIATDVSTRALELAALTLRLNAVHTVELRHGDLFAPLAGERVDRIVSNPPFVITPRREGVPQYEYRDGGRVGDAIVEEVVRGAADHLTAGGTAHLLGNWEYREGLGGDGLARVRRWISESGLDGWVIERERQSPEEYAATWIRDGGTRVGTPEYDTLCAAWLDDFAERGVTAVGFGYIVVRRRVSEDAAPLLHTELLSSPLGPAASGLGDHLLAGFAAHDWMASRDDAALAAERLVLAPDVTEERHHWPGQEAPTVIRLRQGAGFAREIDADPALAGFVGACDGELTVGQLAAALADLLEVDEGALLAQLLPRVRELLLCGVLLPPSPLMAPVTRSGAGE